MIHGINEKTLVEWQNETGTKSCQGEAEAHLMPHSTVFYKVIKYVGPMRDSAPGPRPYTNTYT